MIEYKIKEDTEDVIVKTGGEVEFTMANIASDIEYLNKAKREMEGKLKIEEANKVNIEGTHPHVADMTAEDLTAAYLYRQATGFIHVAKEKIEEIDKQLSEYDSEKAEIKKQLNIE